MTNLKNQPPLPEGNEAKTSNYTVPPGEEDFIHAQIIREEYDPKTGKPLFQPNIQKWNPQEWQGFLRHPHGYVVQELLHVPKGTPRTLEALKAQEEKAKKGK